MFRIETFVKIHNRKHPGKKAPQQRNNDRGGSTWL
jgi:hypothetical protein